MPPKVLVLALDSMDSPLIERYCDEGYLPNLAKLRAESAAFRLANSLDYLPGAIWVELSTGRSVGRDARFYAPLQIHTGEADARKIDAEEVETANDVWSSIDGVNWNEEKPNTFLDTNTFDRTAEILSISSTLSRKKVAEN